MRQGPSLSALPPVLPLCSLPARENTCNTSLCAGGGAGDDADDNVIDGGDAVDDDGGNVDDDDDNVVDDVDSEDDNVTDDDGCNVADDML